MGNIMDKSRKKLEAQEIFLVDDDHNYIPENCIDNILGHLPLESLGSSKLVCKSWYAIVNSPYFRNKHLRRLDLDTRGIIFSTPVQNFSNTKVFSIVSNSTIPDLHSFNYHIKFMEFRKDGKSRVRDYLNTAFRGRIVAAHDGLIVLEKDFRTRGSILLNPVTREQEHIPMGTISSVPYGDLYGLASSSSSSYYKLLRLFMKDKFSNLGCEIMDIIIGSGAGGSSWRAVDVPPTRHYHLLHSPVFAMGALHWIQHVGVDEGECMVSMPLDDGDDEKFKTTAIPPAAKEGHVSFPNFNTVFEMGECLGFSSRTGKDNQIQVWILRGSDDDYYYWEKQYDIDGSGLGYLTPILCSEGDDDDRLVLKCVGGKCFYAYDRHSGFLTKIETINKWAAIDDYWTIFPHVNSLVSWRRRSAQDD